MSPVKWKRIADAIRAQIESGALPPGTPLPSETDLARQYGVCRVTAHRAMFELQRLGLVVRQRKRGTVVATPSPNRTFFVAAVFPFAHNYPQTEYLRGVRNALPDHYHLLLCETHNDPHREAQYLRRMQHEADGVLCYPTCDPKNTPLLQRLLDSGKPVVCVDRQPEGVECDVVMTDNYQSSLTGLRYLLERGHRRVAHYTDDAMYVSSIRERYEAYLQAMQEAGCTEPSVLVRRFALRESVKLDYLAQLVHDALFTQLHQAEPITAVFCLHDYYMVAVLEACDHIGVKVPQDLEVLSFADVPPLMTRVTRSVHRLVQHAYEMGRTAATRLQRRLEGEVIPSEVIKTLASFYPARATVSQERFTSSFPKEEKP
ncbi:MAG: GntR family transcriptional regulator [Armatimonadetes bacterium]|nr:GntR family transcriptional regulator [Armatimonadota bacterium]